MECWAAWWSAAGTLRYLVWEARKISEDQVERVGEPLVHDLPGKAPSYIPANPGHEDALVRDADKMASLVPDNVLVGFVKVDGHYDFSAELEYGRFRVVAVNGPGSHPQRVKW